MDKNFEFFMNHATALEVDIERYKFEMLRDFLNGKNIQWVKGEYGYSRQICTRFLVETAEKLMRGNPNNSKRDSFRIDIRCARHFRNSLLVKIEERLKEYS